MTAGTGKPYLTLDDLVFDGKVTLLRVDINSPIVNGLIAGTDRIAAHADTVRELARRGARTVVIGHQGRKGDDDFTSLKEHAEKLAEFSKVPVHFVDDVYGEKALSAMKTLESGEALMLENVRGVDAETKKGDRAAHARAPHVEALAKVADVMVNDAFSAAHRAQATLVGFAERLPNAAGLQMDRELTALAKAVDDPEPPAVYFLGGAKPEDSIAVMRANFTKGTLDTALLGGVVANLFLVARGQELPESSLDFMRKKGVMDLLPQAEKLLEDFDAGIVTPEDVAVRNTKGERVNLWIEDLPGDGGPVLDIGDETIASYREIIADAGSLMMNGPAGLYEEAPFAKGTKAVLQAFADSDAFSLMGGGHTITAIGQFGFTDADFGYVSLAGGALMSYLTGETLPAVEALRASKAKFGGK